MLLRRFKTCTLVILTVSRLVISQENLDKYQKLGKEVGHSIKRVELSQKEIEMITPEHLRKEKFDENQAKERLKDSHYRNGERKEKIKMDPSINAVLESTENIMQNQKELKIDQIDFQEKLEKCVVENEIVPVTLHHTLKVNVKHKPKKTKKYKKCSGHRKEKKSDNSKQDKKRNEQEFESDPSIKSYNISINEQGLFHRDIVISKWYHVDDTTHCDHYKMLEKDISPETWTESDSWTFDRQELLDSLNCMLVDTKFGPKETRMIQGRKITRSHWNKTQQLQCIKQKQSNCDFFKNKNCILVEEKCLKYNGSHCLILEKLFKCRSKVDKENRIEGVYGSNSSLWDIKYKTNESFPDVATKLAVFNEMKKEMQNSGSIDARNVSLFKGDVKTCSKGFASDVTYDCCDNMDGLSMKVKLSKCASDEIALSESRKKGLSHHIGKRKEKILGVFESKTEHVFCVFSNRLSRVFQEEARKQLNISWGDAQNPNCRGLTQEEIKKLDFSKINLTEAFEFPKEVDSKEKIKQIEIRLKERMGDIS